jgi:hypothetical protein
VFGREQPINVSVYKWYKLFQKSGCVCKGESQGRLPVTEAQVDTFRAAFDRSQRKANRHAAGPLNMPHDCAQDSVEKPDI